MKSFHYLVLPITATAFVVPTATTTTTTKHQRRHSSNGLVVPYNGNARMAWALFSSVTREAPPSITIVQQEEDEDEEEAASSRTLDTTVGSSGGDVNNEDLRDLTLKQLKDELIHLVTTLQGTDTVTLNRIQSCVNLLEERWTPIETVAFFNLFGNAGAVWQLLFSTELRPPADPRKFRLRQLTQTCQHNNKNENDEDNGDPSQGTWTATAVWDLVNEKDESDANNDDDDGYNAGDFLPLQQLQQQPVFDCSGTFSTVHNYRMASTSSSNQKNAAGSCRVHLEFVPDRTTLQLAKGSAVPRDVPGLVARLRRSMPAALFEAPGSSSSSSGAVEDDETATTATTAADTTYLDDTLRIVRYTTVQEQQQEENGGVTGAISAQAAALEGVRDIFIRQEPETNPQGVSNTQQQQQQQDADDDDDNDALF